MTVAGVGTDLERTDFDAHIAYGRYKEDIF
jgi:hypothetical protein